MAMHSGLRKSGRAVLAAVAFTVVAMVAACDRDKVELTQCEGDLPEIARTSDVAPPNC
ncbi:hypothetical protein OEW28_16270 [Defluviimonas sp. WL0002]|uniref:Entry exclusion lipoprotein TrbK n=1 Tax=Albidovulum marisflavi TaxID=2984159 RepID=A0ABT2ZGN8_9RHOB|nr:hypothetical protein [Defluviimonas sp. WL0002]MCV2870187.1 hypothetical protein [Defluviimonas sp. WL0002]